MIGFIVVDGADRVVPEIHQQLKAVAGILSQMFAQPAQVIIILGRMIEHSSSLSS
jgi:50S ribosomal subunit-associated GTPase HflX